MLIIYWVSIVEIHLCMHVYVSVTHREKVVHGNILVAGVIKQQTSIERRLRELDPYKTSEGTEYAEVEATHN